MARVSIALLAVGLVLGACSSPVPYGGPGGPYPAPSASAAFDLALVQSNYRAECGDPIIVDDLFCQQVDIDGMIGAGDILFVPTGLSAVGMYDRASVICEMVLVAHFDGATGHDLGYRTVSILDMNGGNLLACDVPD